MANLSKILSDLRQQRAAAQSDLARIDQALAALTGAAVARATGGKKRGRKPGTTAKKGRRKGMSKTARLAVSRRMKKYWAERKKKEKK